MPYEKRITDEHLQILQFIGEGINYVSRLSYRMEMPRTTIKWRVDALRLNGFIKKETQANYRIYELTDKGQKLVAIRLRWFRAQEEWNESLSKIMSSWEPVKTEAEIRAERLERDKESVRKKMEEDPDGYTAKKIAYYRIVVEQPGWFDDLTVEKKRLHRKLTYLQLGEHMPPYCEDCGSTDDLTIHHKKYTYPIIVRDLVSLCRPCHGRLHAYERYTAEEDCE